MISLSFCLYLDCFLIRRHLRPATTADFIIFVLMYLAFAWFLISADLEESLLLYTLAYLRASNIVFIADQLLTSWACRSLWQVLLTNAMLYYLIRIIDFTTDFWTSQPERWWCSFLFYGELLADLFASSFGSIYMHTTHQPSHTIDTPHIGDRIYLKIARFPILLCSLTNCQLFHISRQIALGFAASFRPQTHERHQARDADFFHAYTTAMRRASFISH